MKILICAIREYFACSLIDEAISLSKAGHEVYFMYNNCSIGICSYNMSQNTYTCELCRRKMNRAVKLLPNGIKKINIQDFWGDKKFHYDYNTAQDVKNIEYKNVKVGYAVMSSYITRTRNLAPLINESSRKYFDLLISATCGLTDALERAIQTIHPEKIYLWNARFIESRPVFDLAKANCIELVCIDNAKCHDGTNRKERFINHTPHDIVGMQKRCDELWEKVNLPNEEKVAIGKSFYERRRAGLRTNDKVYIGNQQAGQMPEDWNPKKKNIVIFNSSEDEFAAIGDEYDSKALFRSQYQGIRYIMDSLKGNQDYHVYLRIHPNLSKIPYRYHTELLSLPQKYENLTVIPGTDQISTYTLMDAAEKIVVFGSTMGVEAAYWGKPVILLAGAWYYYSGVCYVPQSHDELKVLLSQSLLPKDNEAAVKWGFYRMYNDPTGHAQYIDIDSEWFNVGKYHLWDEHYLKLFGSSKLYALYLYLVTRKYRKEVRLLEIPMEEDTNADL